MKSNFSAKIFYTCCDNKHEDLLSRLGTNISREIRDHINWTIQEITKRSIRDEIRDHIIRGKEMTTQYHFKSDKIN